MTYNAAGYAPAKDRVQMSDLVVKGGTLVTAADTFVADVAIAGGRIVAIGSDLPAPDGGAVIQAAGRLVFPGFVDPHVHLQMPIGDITSSDDFFSGSAAAACGGTTTIIDFVEAEPRGSLIEATRRRRAEADPQVCIDYSLHLTGNSAEPAFLHEIGHLARIGYTSLKLYTTYPGLMVEDRALLELLQLAARSGLLPIVHAENDAIIACRKSQLLAAGQIAPRYHPVSRPPAAEVEAVGRVLALAETAGAPVYFVHVSCAGALEAIRRARRAGQEVYTEVTPHHLLLDESVYAGEGFAGARFCCSPPLRAQPHLAALWAALAAGEIDTVATDHCPWDFATHRQRGRTDFTKIPNGLAGVETRVPLLYSEGVGAGRLRLNRFVQACATAPAQLFGLYPQKGSIIVGGDADLVIFDPARQVTLSASTLHQRTDDCPYEGWAVRGYPEIVLARGQVVAREGHFVGRAGAGRFVPRRPFIPRGHANYDQ